jgi:hypothetical protein
MINAWWEANMDARRMISILIAVIGFAVVALGIAASPDSSALAGTYGLFIVPGLIGAAIGGYRRHRVSDPARAPLWGLASGALVAAMMVATLGTALLIRPTVRGIPGLEDAWSGVFASGILIGLVGAVLWERDFRRRRFAALLGFAFLLIAGGVFVRSSGDAWAMLGALVALGGFGVVLVAFEMDRRSSRQDTARPDTWR